MLKYVFIIMRKEQNEKESLSKVHFGSVSSLRKDKNLENTKSIIICIL